MAQKVVKIRTVTKHHKIMVKIAEQIHHYPKEETKLQKYNFSRIKAWNLSHILPKYWRQPLVARSYLFASLCSMHTAHCSLLLANCILHTASYTLHTAHCTLHTVHCTLHTSHYTPYTVHCTLQMTEGQTWWLPRAVWNVWRNWLFIAHVHCKVQSTVLQCSVL